MVQSQDYYEDSFRSEGSRDYYSQSMRSAASGSSRDFYSSSGGESFRGNRSNSTFGRGRRGRRRGDQRGPVNNSLSSGTSEYTDNYTRDEDPNQSSGVYSMASESAYFDTAPSIRDINQTRGGGMPKFRPPLRGAESQSVDPSPFSSANQNSLLNDQGQSLRSFGSNLIGLDEEEGYYRDQNPQGDDGMVDNMDDFAEEDEEEDLPPSPLRQLLDAINMSILPSSLRLSSLSQAVEFFDHRDRAMHDAELREGAAFVLYHKLGLILKLSKSSEMERMYEMSSSSSSSMMGGGMGESSSRKPGGSNHYMMAHYNTTAHIQQQSEHDKEIAMVCSCLEMVHRADPDAIAQTWDECGAEILPLLVAVLERPFNKIEHAVWTAIQEKANVPGSLERAVAMAVTRDQKLAVQKVTKVLAMYSLVPEAKKPMCECDGMLRWLTRIIDTHNYNRVKPGAPIFGGTAAAGGVNAPFVEPTASNSNKPEDAEAKRVARLALASRATSGSGLYMTEAARFNTIATLTNLAALESNRMQMISEPGLIDNICRAVHNERSDVPKQCSALAIMNLSNGDPDHVPEMASNDLVLETLLKLMREDNPETRRNAVVTIFNVACSDANTVKLARYRDGTILEALTELVGADDPFRLHDEARSNAAETLFNMSCSEISETTDRMANHAGLLECLAVTLRGEHTGLEVKMYCAATLRRMSELIRHPMIAQGALLSALVKAATWTSTDCIAEAFRAQASVPENCVIMANHHGLLNALSRLALAQGEDSDIEKVRMAAVGAIELMSRQDDARELLAHNEGIMMALTRASYGEGARASMRRSTLSEVDKSHVSQASYGEDQSRVKDGESDDDSIQSRRIQVALKNLVSAM